MIGAAHGHCGSSVGVEDSSSNPKPSSGWRGLRPVGVLQAVGVRHIACRANIKIVHIGAGCHPPCK